MVTKMEYAGCVVIANVMVEGVFSTLVVGAVDSGNDIGEDDGKFTRPGGLIHVSIRSERKDMVN